LNQTLEVQFQTSIRFQFQTEFKDQSLDQLADKQHLQ